MNICDLNSGLGRLQRSAARLKERWQETRTVWMDQTQRQFQEQHLDSLPPQISMVLAATQRLAESLEQAEKACADESEC
ncbi:MAG: hypothetical protein MK364_13015 [Pirellulales bacterium]|jgi:hypothetical protein|nr:hypothetical protein [Pirellulales bacterium]